MIGVSLTEHIHVPAEMRLRLPLFFLPNAQPCMAEQ